MGYGRYVGRVGGLAVALGIGLAIGGPVATAWAEPGSASGSSSESNSAAADSADRTRSRSDPSDDATPGGRVAASGSADEGTAVRVASTGTHRKPRRVSARRVVASVPVVRHDPAPGSGTPAPVAAVAVLTAATGATRRQVDTAKSAAAPQVANSAPTAQPSTGNPDQVTGRITGNVNGLDAEGDSLSFVVKTPPTSGALDLTATTGAIGYTPTVAARLRAGTTTGVDFDGLTVGVSDNRGGSTEASVSVPVLPAGWATRASGATGARPWGVAVVGNKAYVANQGTNTVSVIDAGTGSAIGAAIGVGSAPTGVVASADGAVLYVANRTSGTVSVIRTSDNTAVGSAIQVGSLPESITLNADGTRAYVTNFGTNTVSVIDTVARRVVDVQPATLTVDSIKVGTDPRGIAFATTANGQRVYVVNRASGTVSVISAAANTVVDTKPSTSTIDAISVGSLPEHIAVSKDGKWAYVTNQGSRSVSVINTATNVVESTISVETAPAGIALSGDGSVAYVANGNDRISMIDTVTRTVIATVQVDSASESGNHMVAVKADGDLLITDEADRALRVLDFVRGNTAPASVGTPTVDNAAQSNGSVTGLVNIKDYDGDPLSYTTVGAPSKGSVSYDSVAGTYTYLPTAAARAAAAQSPASDVFTVRVADAAGGFKDASITVPISPAPAENRPPTTGWFYTAKPDGTVTGVLATDPDGDPLTFVRGNGPWDGSIVIDLQTGAFTYTPTFEARARVAMWPEYNTDWMTYTVTDGGHTVNGEAYLEILPVQIPPAAYGSPSVDSVDPVMGRVTGSTNAFDPNGDVVTYTVSRAPSRGAVTVSQDGAFAYLPNAAARTAGGFDTFEVRASDAYGHTDFGVTVPIRPFELAAAQTQISIAAGAYSMAVRGNRAYIANYGGTVSQIDLTTNTVMRVSDPIGASVSGDSGVAVSPDGTRVYVASPIEGKVVVLEAATLKPTGAPIIADFGSEMVISPDGSRLYLADEGTASSLRIIDTAARNVVGSVPIGVETTDLAISSDGKTVYVADGYNNSVRVIDAAAGAQVAAITLGPPTYLSTPAGIALSPDGRWAYVTDTVYGTVSVIDTTTKTVVGTPITVGMPRTDTSIYSWITGITVSPDGRKVFVANGNDIVVLDAITRTVLGAIRIPTWAHNGSLRDSQAIAVDSNGDIVVIAGDGVVSVTLGAAAVTGL